jgi:transposase
MVHAAVHTMTETRELIHQAGHTVLFLPPDSLDFNPIKQDFATIKTRRQYATPDTSLDDMIRSGGTYWE